MRSASRLRGAKHLTASVDSLSFIAPTRIGDIAYVTTQARLPARRQPA